MRGPQQAQAVEVIALDDQIAMVSGALRGVAAFRHQPRQNHIGIKRGIAFNGI